MADEDDKVHRSSLLAWALIIFFVLMALSTLINQSIQIGQNLGWLEKTK